jgi:inner membrane protein
MSITHAALSVAGTSLFLGETSSFSLFLAVIGSQLPDLDTTKSIMGRSCYPIARFIEVRFSHRTITHSLLATSTIALISLPIAYYFSVKTWLVLPLAHLIACFSDTFTKEGVALFYPCLDRCIYGNNPNFRLRTGSTVEYWILAAAIALSIWLFNLQSNGGLLLSFNQVLGIRDGVTRAYNKYGANHHIWVNLTGNHTSDRRVIDGRFFLVAAVGEEFILQDEGGIYKTKEQIEVNRITATTGASATTNERSLIFNDDDIKQLLTGLASSGSVYLSGTLEIDEPEDIILNPAPNQHPTLTKTDKTVVLSYCPLQDAIAILDGQFGYGILTARIISPSPF